MQHIFHVGLISSGFSDNTESECTWTYLTWAYTKPHAQLKVNSIRLGILSVESFFFFFLLLLALFCQNSQQVMATAGSMQAPLRESVKGAQPLGRALLGAFLPSRTCTTEAAALARAPRPSFPETLKSGGSLLTLTGKGYTRRIKCKRLKVHIKTCPTPLPVSSEG